MSAYFDFYVLTDKNEVEKTWQFLLLFIIIVY